MFFFFEFLPQHKLVFFFFLPTCLLALRVLCGYFMGPYTLFPPLSLLLPLMPTPAYFHHHHLFPLACSHLLLPSSPIPTNLLPRTFTIAACFCHYRLFRYLTCFFAYFCHHHLLPSSPILVYFHHCHLPVLAIVAYFHLLPPSPLACFHHCRLLPPTSIIVASLGTSPASTYFTICLPILVVGMFELQACPLCLVFLHLSICVEGGT